MKVYHVQQEWVSMRLDKIVTSIEKELSREMVQKLLQEGHITVNKKPVKASYKVQLGDQIEVEVVEAKESPLAAQDIPIPVLYEDEDMIVVNKPKGMVVHPANGNQEGTLVNALMHLCKGSLSGIGGEKRPGIVHRLDKDTSGILMVAKNDQAHTALSKQIQERKIEKIYLALVRGEIKDQEATIHIPIARSKKDRKKMAVDKDGKDAITHFEVLERYVDYTLLKIRIETGRTHQIRVHLSHIGYPVVGDSVYSNGKNPFGVEGQMLHAYELVFHHPITNKKMQITAQTPLYFEQVLEQLEKIKSGS